MLLVFSSFAEFFSIASIVPFITVLTNPTKLFDIFLIKQIANILGYQNADQLLLPFVFLFMASSTIAGLIKIINIWLSNKYSAFIGSDFSIQAYQKIISQPLIFFKNKKSSEIINAVIRQSGRTTIFIKFTIQFLSTLLIIFSIVGTLLFINWRITFIAFIVFLLFYTSFISILRKRLISNGAFINESSQKQIKGIQEGIGGIREIILNQNHNFYLSLFNKVDRPLKLIEAQNQSLLAFPRYILETVGLIMLASLSAVIGLNNSSNTDAIVLIAVFGLGAQRLLPAMQQCYTAFGGMYSEYAAVIEIIKTLELKENTNIKFQSKNKFQFKNNIQLEDVSFKYTDNSDYILRNINCKINAGERVAIIGKTGTGKSTLTDLIMGLLLPSNGKIMVDGIDINKSDGNYLINQWRSKISHVPQNIFLADSSITENIAFGIPKNKINFEKVVSAAKQSQIFDFISESKDGFDMQVGEKGVKLSGGQKQRIAIARALYRDSKLLVLDEATSALDFKTEKIIMKSIDNLSRDITIIKITHKINLLKSFDKIFYIDKNKSLSYIDRNDIDLSKLY